MVLFLVTKQHGVGGGDSKFQNVPRCLGPQERVPLVQVPKPPTIYSLSACYLKTF